MLHLRESYLPFLNKLKTLLILLSLTTSVLGQQFHFTNYSLNEGLPQSQVFALCEDQRGYIWMGTNGGGLSAFNGFEFKTYTSADGLPSNYILSMAEDNKGMLWIGTKNGLATFNGKKIKIHPLPGEKLAITCILEDHKNQIWLGTNSGIFRKDKNEFIPFRPSSFPDKGIAINFIEETNDGRIWIGTNNGTYILDGKNTEHLSTKNGLISNLSQSMGSDSAGNIWIGSYGKGLNLITSSGIADVNSLTGLTGTAVFSILCDAQGLVWITTQEKGLCKFNPLDSSHVFLTEKDGLANNHARSLLHDRWGNYWIGTSGGGVSKYAGQQFEKYGKGNGLPGNYIYSVAADHNNNLWVGATGGGINKLSSNTFTRFGSDSNFVDDKIRTVFVDSDSLIWLGIDGKGLAQYNGDTFIVYNEKHGLAGNFVKSIDEDSRGRIWVASAGGGITLIHKTHPVEGGFSMTKYNTSNYLKSNRVIQVHVDKLDRVWFANQTSGVGVFENDSTVKYFSKSDGLASDDIRSLTEDQFGNLWIGGTGGLNALPLYRESLKIQSIPSTNLSSVNIYQLIADAENNIWVGTEKGLDRLKIDSSLSILESTHFGGDEGFTGVETNLNAVCLDRENNLWFGTVDGLFKYLSRADVKNKIAPILSLQDISLHYISLSKTAYDSLYHNGFKLEFYHDENHLTFDFLGVTQTIPGKVKYKWRLIGLEKDWSPPAKRNSVTYSNLAPGKYTFEVLSANENEVWNNEPLRFEFEIKAPFWQKGWFRIVLLFAALLLIVIFTATIIRQINKKSRERQEKLKTERDLISLEQKALRLQMNPHFIFHTLNNIQSLIATKDEATARIYLSKFSKLMRQILENSRSNEITLENEIETLQNYLSIERFCHDNSFEFNIEVDENLETAFIMIPPMILQPFVENAIVHGVAPLQGGGQINISFMEKDGSLTCTITDNGIGRKAAAQRIDANHKSTALAVTKQRLSLINPESESVAIEDLKVGTKVVVRLG